MSALTYSFVKENGVLLFQDADQWVLAHKASASLAALNEGLRVSPIIPQIRLLEADAFDAEVVNFYQREGGQTLANVQGLGDDLESVADAIPENEDLLENEGDAPIIRLINAILSEAIKEGASDIHIETFERRLQVRFRVDGVLREVVSPKRALAPMLVSRIKVMAKLDIAEKRVPQDGRILLRISGQDTDVRVSTLPSTHGERIVMRLLSKQAGKLDLSHLGMGDGDRQLVRQLLDKPHGILLVTGPTGSGKTTSLYASLTYLNDGKRNIMTVEDPVEYHIEGIGQTQVNTKADMTFARGLRAILRQDPDVVMIGEIRDKETAEIAVQASLTGHLVLSTLHTNSAVGAITRLQDMGVEPFLLSSSVVGVLAQRLVRRLCDHCKAPIEADDTMRSLMGEEEPMTLYRPVGCDACHHQGFRGRLGLYEIIVVDDVLQEKIHQGAGEQDMARYVRTIRPSLRADGLNKVRAGLTSLEEVLRVSNEDIQPLTDVEHL